MQRFGRRIPVLFGISFASAIAFAPILFARDPLSHDQIVAALRERAIRDCDGGELAFQLCDLDFDGTGDDVILALSERFTESCGNHPEVRQFADRARRRTQKR